jgi:glycerate kinase
MDTAQLILAPDSYKGSASARAVAIALRDGLQQACPGLAPVIAPMADGGEGTLDCVAAALAGIWRELPLEGVHDQPMTGCWYQTDDNIAVIESAQVLGLPLIEAVTAAPPLRRRSSYALGRLVTDALDAGARHLIVGLGGSACNDAGLGLLSALGARAADNRGRALTPSMDSLLALATFTLDGLDPRLAETDIRVLCDVDNPLLGVNGASRVYGPQKGLTEAEIEAVEAAFARLAAGANAQAAAELSGSGAAGGLGFALAALGGRLESGAEALLALTGLREALPKADLVVTGEGRSDTQTLSGKLPLAIARAAAPKPAVLVAGSIAENARADLETHFIACHTLVERAGAPSAARAEPEHWLRAIGADIGRNLPRLVNV